jgi:mono/diheme cytochrome c family protein
MKYLRIWGPILAITAALPVVSAQQKVIKQVPARPTALIAGKDLFRQYCAVCHGVDGKGAGPAAEALKKSPSDLTQMARRTSGGKFPETEVLKMLKGETTVAAHGSSDMPVWGPIFRNMSNSAGMTQTRLYSLLQYLEEIQAK